MKLLKLSLIILVAAMVSGCKLGGSGGSSGPISSSAYVVSGSASSASESVEDLSYIAQVRENDSGNEEGDQSQPSAPPAVPEPATMILFAGGLVGMIVRYVRKGFQRIKRLMDFVLSLVGLALACPILLFSALLIKLDSPGPVLYRQKRLGKNRREFTIFKLRTMRQDAEQGTGAVWAVKDDPRVTGVGRVLRKTRIDELPQLINVLRGDMSIVGPRPERPELVLQLKEAIRDYEHRLSVKPGITGLAQVVHKYDENISDVKKKVKYDLLYIRKMCLLTDLDILARTFGVVVTGKGAN